jgi:translation initiation factor 2 gamma subunit (eIF-2gamma)
MPGAVGHIWDAMVCHGRQWNIKELSGVKRVLHSAQTTKKAGKLGFANSPFRH